MWTHGPLLCTGVGTTHNCMAEKRQVQQSPKHMCYRWMQCTWCCQVCLFLSHWHICENWVLYPSRTLCVIVCSLCIVMCFRLISGGDMASGTHFDITIPKDYTEILSCHKNLSRRDQNGKRTRKDASGKLLYEPPPHLVFRHVNDMLKYGP